MKKTICRLSRIFFITASLTLLASCATVDQPDPYESYNRQVFKFNRAVDKVLFRPIAVVYDTITPNFMQRGISNFFANVYQVPTIANDVLQANPGWALSDIMRLVVNSTVGIGGLIDVAKPLGLEPHDQTFGLTLARWGYTNSSYLILPFLPPGTVRDLAGLGVDSLAFSVWPYIDPHWIAYAAAGTSFIIARAQFLSTDKLVDEALDPYVFVRDAYLQRMNARIEKVTHPDAES